MFSPMVPIISLMVSATVALSPGNFAFISLSRLPLAPIAVLAMEAAMSWNGALRATKSVSELTSTRAASCASAASPISPSAATRPAFLAALARPLALSQSTAASMSPPVSPSAALQSIMPAPVLSRRSFTMVAVIVAIVASAVTLCRPKAPASASGWASCRRPCRAKGSRVAALLPLARARIGLPRRRLALAFALAFERLLGDRLLGRAEIGADRSLRPLDAVDRRARDQVAIERDGAAGVVVAGDGMADAVGIAIRVHHRHHRHVQLARLGDGDRLLVGVDDEHEIGKRSHVLDAAEGPLELLLLAGELEQLLLGEAVSFTLQHL